MKRGLIQLLAAAGTVLFFAGIVAGLLRMDYLFEPPLFWPPLRERVAAQIPAFALCAAGLALIVFAAVSVRRGKRRRKRYADSEAEAYSTPAFSYESAGESLQARIRAWESATWADELRRKEVLQIIKAIASGVQDLGKMSSWFSLSLSDPPYESARDALRKADTDTLRLLSGFFAYCSSLTDYEISGKHFITACKNTLAEINKALELYAVMRAKLSGPQGGAGDYERLKAEINNIKL
ncbi:MAG: hypothetical protein LBI44_06110 [Oscillospiraceae bacterium]|jgi:hypothetical protein|nr:hypothetical protein [Oscillospiraceae bacterium]